MRKQIAAANWKMNLTLQEGKQLAYELLQNRYTMTEDQLVIIAVPFPYLTTMIKMAEGKKKVAIAAQNMSQFPSGAYTGEVSAAMLTSIGIRYVLIGHSERRQYFSENDAMLAEKVNLALSNNISPIFCCGEPLDIREHNREHDYVSEQIDRGLFHLTPEDIKKVIIAYEPIWAIGTGRTATSDQAQDMHAHIRKVLAGKYGEEIANEISILYGGSVKAANASEIFSKPDVDGGLVGGASLVASEFAEIINGLV